MDEKDRDRYDVSGNVEAQYVDEDETILVNKQGIADLETLQRAEEEALAKAYETLLSEVRTDTPLTCELLTYVHDRIFGELYEWAGRWRTVQISKPGAIWPPPRYLDDAMRTFEQDVLTKYPVPRLGDDEAFCRAAGEIQGEFLAIHPFREGNARTIKLLTDLLAVQTGRPMLLYDDSEAGKQRYIDAAKAVLLRKDCEPMTDVIRDALREAMRQSGS